MKRASYRRILLIALPFLFAGVAIGGMPVYQYLAQGRPLCLPQLSRGGQDAPQAAAGFGSAAQLKLPAQEDWVDYGPVLEAGGEGAWDFMWAGATPASVVQKDGRIFFYYVAADGYRSFDGDARHRAVGVATSQDGLRFRKYGGNPIITHRPYDGEEEGANSAAVTLDENGRFVMVYGAASGPHDTIVAEARLAYANDGLQFRDAGRVLYHCDLSLYGAGDEIFPLALLRQPERWMIYYQPNGMRGTERTLGAAWGPALDEAGNSTMVLDEEGGGLPVDVWGNVIEPDEETLLFFGQRLWWPDTYIEVRSASPETPYRLSEPLARYDIVNLKRGIVFLDRERRTWFMYYNDFSRFWKVKLAPFGAPDDTPPGRPQISGRATGDDNLRLSWGAAPDPETGVAEYRIYRNGRRVGSTRDLTWRETQLRPGASYRYAVTAVNFHGAESAAGEVVVRTGSDGTPPAVTSVSANGDATRVRITFSEAVDRATATELDHYEISGGIAVRSVTLTGGGRAVLLETTPHEAEGVYYVAIRGVADRSSAMNTMSPATIGYTPAAAGGLVGRWLAGEDVSGYGLQGVVHGAGPADPAQAGDGALVFDGVDDYVQIAGEEHLQAITSGSFTLAAWVRPDTLPASPQGGRIFGRVGEHPASFVGLSLLADGRVEAALFQEDETRVVLRSAPVALQQWHHIAMIVDADSGQLALIVDGAAVPDSPQDFDGSLLDLWTASPRDDRSGAYFIASTMPDRGAGAAYAAYFQGAIRDARIYDRALITADVQVIRQK